VREEVPMTLQGIGVMQPAGNGPFQLRLRFDKHAYCAIELKKGEASKSIAKKFRELALEVERLEKGKG
jgi:hypothetical protein